LKPTGGTSFEEDLARQKLLYVIATGSRFGRFWVRRLKTVAYFPASNALIRSGESTIQLAGFGMKLDPSSWQDLRVWRAHKQNRGYEPGTTALLTSLLRPGMTFVDVGANNGYFSLLAASIVTPSGHVFAFEPAPETYQRLLRNVAINGFANVKAQALAVGARQGRAFLHSMNHNDGAASLLALGREFHPIEVAIDSLDSQLRGRSVDVVKVDVEGFEEQVLEGMGELVAQNPQLRLICEYNYPLLREKGYRGDELLDQLSRLGFSAWEIPEVGQGLSSIHSYDDLSRACANLYCTRDSQDAAVRSG